MVAAPEAEFTRSGGDERSGARRGVASFEYAARDGDRAAYRESGHISGSARDGAREAPLHLEHRLRPALIIEPLRIALDVQSAGGEHPDRAPAPARETRRP